ncbi:primosomal replication protein N [Gayadomonas joobiniege]|uniref:primosomal replication protein N n=1 Tax=Gayadomonas joobiniege TaxID=1234606 RepID=UPI00037810C2|nr:primosomal replication protein N [Gayadomonas joobiniege]
MLENSLVIAGKLVKAPKFSTSPAGIPHCHFVLEHLSEQYEAGMPRRVWCRIKVVASGLTIQQQVKNLTAEQLVRAEGFLQRQESINGLAQLILHAQRIQQID